MKIFITIVITILMTSSSFAYDESLLINVKQVSRLLNKANLSGKTPGGAPCEVELRRIEDGYYTVYSRTATDEIFIALDLEVYGITPVSSWTKTSFELEEPGCISAQNLKMRVENATKKLVVDSRDEYEGHVREIRCYLPLK
jgi:hypothetical protein